MRNISSLRVALVHDDLVQWGGAERVLLALTEVFPNAPIYTSVFDQNNQAIMNFFSSKKIITSFMQKIPFWRYLYKALLPIYPIAFEQFDFSKFDLVLHHSTRFSKSVITKPQTLHICYLATPPRFLWNLSGEKVRSVIKPYLSLLRVYDQISSQRVDVWWAGSENAQKRIERIYRKKSFVCHPFIDFKRIEGIESFEGDYYLIVARLNAYKRVDIAVDYFNKTNLKLKIVGVGPQSTILEKRANSNIEFLEGVSEELLSNLMSGCRALIITGEEDFGLTSLEAQAFGKPVIAYGFGGVRETLIEDKTGVFFYNQTSESLGKALEKLSALKINREDCLSNARNFSKDKFMVDVRALLEKL